MESEWIFVRLADQSELYEAKKWLVEQGIYSLVNRGPDFWFGDEQSAIMFKLRWG
jgi:hypothetical protein